MKKRLMNRNTRKNLITYLVVIAAFAVMQILSAAGALKSATAGLLVPICVYIVLAVSLNLVVGVSGELSLGHAGFMGVGAFSGIVAAVSLQNAVPSDPVRLLIAMVVGGILAGVFGLIVGFPVMRLRGDYLAIVTLAFGEILKNLVGNLYVGTDSAGLHVGFSDQAVSLAEGGKMIINGPMGTSGISRIATFPMGFALVLFSLFVVLNLVNSKEGRAIKAIRDNRIAAESVGIPVTAFRLKAFVVSAFLAGMAGALFGLNFSSVAASKFNFNTSINILVFVVLGGMGNILGSVISATVLYVLPEAMRSLEDYRMLLYAVVLIVVMLCTWSPKFKGAIQALPEILREKLGGKKRREAGSHE